MKILYQVLKINQKTTFLNKLSLSFKNHKGLEYNFDKYDYIDLLGLPYDFKSVMHYSPDSFTKNGLPTIVALQPNVTLGQRFDLSEIDIAEIQRYYGCTGKQ